MCGAMIHRGPDDEGAYVAPGIGLGMRRLSIIDLATGRQPVHNEDESIWVVFNGEIYNFAQLRPDLERQGHVFYTGSDTEVIVHLYEQYGESCVEKLRGMFTFAIWDQRRRQLFVARDRLGVKPLFFGEAGGRFVFGSELKVVLQDPAFDRGLNWASVSHLFAAMCTPVDESIIAGIHKLPPGHFLTASAANGVRVRKYWDVRFEPDYDKSEEYFVARLRELLEESVRLRLISDVPLGAFLSGGIDSSAVVATMARIGSGKVKTFSIGFEDPDFNELQYARAIARQYGTDHHELILDPDVLDIIEELPWFLDEPFGDSSAIPTYMVSKLASASVTVVLSGDGGDELFGGYDRYVVEQKERRIDRVPSAARKMMGVVGDLMRDGARGKNFLRHIAHDGDERYLDANVLFRRADRERVFQPDAFRQVHPHDPHAMALQFLQQANGHWLSRLQYLDIKQYLPNDILTKVDRMSMAHSIEAREPLLDHKLVEFAATIPPELKLKGQTTKYIFKKAMEGILPPDILHRPKRGFAVPLGRWFRGKLNTFVRDLLLSKTSRDRGILDPACVERVLRLNDQGRNMDLQLWTMISFELWCRKFVDQSESRVDETLSVKSA
jgi:asparagine synthase (glutamine-hydrolysing)